jgi:hypothetical protein
MERHSLPAVSFFVWEWGKNITFARTYSIKMVNNEIFAITNSILQTVGDACEKIYLFGSYAYGTPRENSDYDFFVVLKDGTEKPLEVMENIHCNFGRQGIFKSIDVLAGYKSRFEVRNAKFLTKEWCCMKVLELVQEWLRYAHNDLISARHPCENIYPKQIEIACYHCQQSTEKVLKGIYTSKMKRFRAHII